MSGEDEEWFEEYCSVCHRWKDKCQDDEMTSCDNPGFICSTCKDRRDYPMRIKTYKLDPEFHLILDELSVLHNERCRFSQILHFDVSQTFNCDEWVAIDMEFHTSVDDYGTIHVSGIY